MQTINMSCLLHPYTVATGFTMILDLKGGLNFLALGLKSESKLNQKNIIHSLQPDI